MSIIQSFREELTLTRALKDLRSCSPVSFCIERFFCVAQFLSLANLLFGTRCGSHRRIAADPKRVRELTMARGRKVEVYVFIWACLLAALWWKSWDEPRVPNWVSYVAAYRVVELLQFFLNFMFFDHLRIEEEHRQASVPRTVLLTLWNFVELVACFGFLYASSPELVLDSRNNPIAFASEALYFSAIAQLTIGFGDLHPVGVFRVLVPAQGVIGLLLTIVAVARLVALLPAVTPVFGEPRRPGREPDLESSRSGQPTRP